MDELKGSLDHVISNLVQQMPRELLVSLVAKGHRLEISQAMKDIANSANTRLVLAGISISSANYPARLSASEKAKLVLYQTIKPYIPHEYVKAGEKQAQEIGRMPIKYDPATGRIFA